MNDNLLDGESSPNSSKSTGKRLSKAPIIIAGLVIIVFVGAIIVAMARRDIKAKAKQDEVVITETISPFKKRKVGIITSNQPPLKEIIEKPDPKLQTNKTQETKVVINTKAIKPEKNLILEAYAKRREEMYQAYLNSLKADTAIRTSNSSNDQNSLNNPKNPNNTLTELQKRMNNAKSRLANLQAGGATGGQMQGISEQLTASDKANSLSSVMKAFSNDKDLNQQDKKNAFFNRSFNDDDYNYHPHNKVPEKKKYVLKEGSFIDGILITGINSDMPGRVVGQVSKTIYDTETGIIPMIPQGTKLVGEYSSGITYGQNRVAIAWTRIIYPNGSSINITNMGGTDQEGYSGFHDKVNNHYFRIFGNAFLLSGITAVVNLSTTQNPELENDTGNTIANALTQQLSQVGIEMIKKNMSIQPTIEIRAGYKFKIYVMKDLILPPKV